MAKTSMIVRDQRRRKTVERYAARRAELKKQARDPKRSLEERREALAAIQKLPRDSSPSRIRNRCNLTGRPRGYYRRFGLCRNKLREIAMRGEAPGVVRASW